MGKAPVNPADELRELIREANGTLKDLRTAMKEADRQAAKTIMEAFSSEDIQDTLIDAIEQIVDARVGVIAARVMKWCEGIREQQVELEANLKDSTNRMRSMIDGIIDRTMDLISAIDKEWIASHLPAIGDQVAAEHKRKKMRELADHFIPPELRRTMH